MAAFASVVLKNAADVDVTFAPRDINNGVALLVKSDGVPVGEKRLVLTMARPTASGRRKVSFKIVVPIVQDVEVAGVTKPTVVRTAYADVVFQFDSTSSATERNDIRDHVRTLLNTTFAELAVDSLEGPW